MAGARQAAVGEASDGEEAIRLAVQTRPDVVLMDVRMSGLGGVAVTARLTAAANPPKVIINPRRAQGPGASRRR